MARVLMYCTRSCPYCQRAERLLRRKKAKIEKIDLGSNQAAWNKMEKLTGRNTVPQIYIGDKHIGGFDDLTDLDMAGQLDTLLAG